MAPLKHVGRIKNTGRRCVVVFRQMYDDRGNVTDEHNCLVFESESLRDPEHQDLMRIVESGPAQSTGDIYNVLARERLTNGQTALVWLKNTNRLRKFPTDNIELMPDSKNVIRLDTLNKIVKMQQQGMSQEDIENVLRDDTDMPPKQASSITEDIANNTESRPAETTSSNDVMQSNSDHGVLDDSQIAQGYIKQAETFESQAKELREQAYDLDPSLKPKTSSKRGQKKKDNSNTENSTVTNTEK